MSFYSWNQHQIYYQQQGTGESLIILPGNTASTVAYQSALDHYSQSYQAVCLDFLGTGKSDRINQWSENWWQESADQVSQLINHLGRKQATLVGSSGGALIALLTATLYPTQVKAVVADSFAHPFTKEMLELNVHKEREIITKQKEQFWQAMHGKDWQQVIKQDTQMIEKFVMAGGDCFQGNLNKIKCPVLLTFSRQDKFIPEPLKTADKISNRIVRSKIWINDKGGHPLMWTDPQAFYAMTEAFFRVADWCKLQIYGWSD